jgi:hypothetical protein
MMRHEHELRWMARVLLSVLCGIQGVATVAIDLNRTHATNPRWVGHARFHVVWQTLTMALLAVVELVLLWGGYVDQGRGFYLALALAGLSPVAFLLSSATRKVFGGTLFDANGIPPLPVRVGSRVVQVDMNLVAVVGALVAMGGIVVIYRW